jgi:glycosyltransferase involved in cell wall biosynthesis
MNETHTPRLTVAIPTYRREQVLLDSVRYVSELSPKPFELLVVDQTALHERSVAAQLKQWNEDGTIRWIQLTEPSIPRAMNRALVDAAGEIVLFLDDDIVPDAALIAAHLHAHEVHSGAPIAGRVLQPWLRPRHHLMKLRRFILPILFRRPRKSSWEVIFQFIAPPLYE